MHNVLRDFDSLKKNAVEVIVHVFVVVKVGEILLLAFGKDWVFNKLLARGSFLGIDLDHDLQHGVNVRREMLRNLRKGAFKNFFVQPLHIFSLKWRFEGNHFINHTPQTPHVTLDVVRLIFPHLRRSVVGRARLSVIQPLLVSNLADVHVSQLGLHIVVKENVGALQITVHDFDLMH